MSRCSTSAAPPGRAWSAAFEFRLFRVGKFGTVFEMWATLALRSAGLNENDYVRAFVHVVHFFIIGEPVYA